MISQEALRNVDQQLIDRYSQRLETFGRDPRTLGWDSRQSQDTRFAIACDSVTFSHKTILDIGCGLADFYDYLSQQKLLSLGNYTGFDINPALIQECQQRFPQCTFAVQNILIDPLPAQIWDVVTLFGLLNFRFQDFANLDFAKQMITQAFALSQETLIVDMLSANVDANYPPEDFVYYYKPSEMLDFALSLTPHVMLRHDYRSIPQREFMLILKKSPCPM